MSDMDFQHMTNNMKSISQTVENETMEITTDFTLFYNDRMPVKSPSYMSMSIGNHASSSPTPSLDTSPPLTPGTFPGAEQDDDSFVFPETSLESIPAFDPRLGEKTESLKISSQGSTSPGYKDVFNFSLPEEPRFVSDIS